MPKTFLVWTVIFAGISIPLYAAGNGVGMITSSGQFLLNDSRVTGNATLTDGARIQMSTAPSTLRLSGGARVELGLGAKATVYRDRLVLESGSSDLVAPSSYELEASTLRFSPAAPGTAARVVRSGEKAVQVGVSKGAVRVYNSNGVLLANVFPGLPLRFEPQVAGAGAPSSFAGCLMKKNGKWIVYDQTTRIIAELRGSGFEKEWGNRVQVVGTTDSTVQSEVGAQVVDVTSVTRFGEGGCQPVATTINAELPTGARAGGGGTVPATTGGGMSAGTKVAIVGAVAAGAGVGVVLATRGDSRSN
jgi:hypothetical protein